MKIIYINEYKTFFNVNIKQKYKTIFFCHLNYFVGYLDFFLCAWLDTLEGIPCSYSDTKRI